MIFLTLFLTFLKIGAFTFGGGYAMIPLIQEQVLAKGWVSEEELLNFIAVSESTPGPFAINIATYIGTKTGGVLGAVCATLGVVVPSFVIILIVAKFFEKFKNSAIVKGCMTGLKPAVIGLIGSAAVSTALTVFSPKSLSFNAILTLPFISSAIIFAVSLYLALKKKHPIFIVILSAAAGIAVGYLGKIV